MAKIFACEAWQLRVGDVFKTEPSGSQTCVNLMEWCRGSSRSQHVHVNGSDCFDASQVVFRVRA
jgi:hypothetical protein